MRFHLQGQSYQFIALPFGLSTAPMEFTVVGKGVKFIALQKGIRIHQYLDNWLVKARSHQTCLQHTQTSQVALSQELGWLVNKDKSELGSSLSGIGLASEQRQIRTGSKTGFQLRRLPVQPERRQGQTHPRVLADPTSKNKRLHGWPGPETNVPDRLTEQASQKQLEGTRDTRKSDPHSQVTPLPSEMGAGGRQCTHRSTITPSKTCSANLYRRIKGNEHTTRGDWSLPESKLHLNYVELKTIFLALKEFQDLYSNNIVPITTDNTTVVAYINKEGESYGES